MHLDRHYFRGKLNFIANMVAVICRARNQTQKQEQTETQPWNRLISARREQVLMGDMDHPMLRIGRQIDLIMPRHILKVALDIRLLHEAKAQLDADDAAAFFVAVEIRSPDSGLREYRGL